MDFLQPSSWDEALAVQAERPDALPIAGGTDVMVELNFDRRRPGALLDLTRIGELREWSLDDGSVDGGMVRLGAGVPYGRVISELGGQLPGLAMAARTVGSPQIRVRGTVGGNLGGTRRLREAAAPGADPPGTRHRDLSPPPSAGRGPGRERRPVWQLPLLVHDERSAQTAADAALDAGSRPCPNPNTPRVVPAGSRADQPTGAPIRPLAA